VPPRRPPPQERPDFSSSRDAGIRGDAGRKPPAVGGGSGGGGFGARNEHVAGLNRRR
jgi:hypothetical protein